MRRKRLHIVFVVAVGLVFLLPSWNMVFLTLPDASQHEHRKLASMPGIKLQAVDSLPYQFDIWFNDHFSFRNALINGRMALDILLFKQSPIPAFVVIGKEKWLYNTGHEIEIYRGTNRFDEEELQILSDKLSERKQFITSHNARMIYVVAPTKYSVYPEFLPLNLNRINHESRTDQFVRILQQERIPFVDLREALLRAKNDSLQLFYKGDNHWTHHGAFVAYQAVIRYLYSLDTAVGAPLALSDYTIISKPTHKGNLSDMLYLRNGCGDVKFNYQRKVANTTKSDTHRIYTPPSYFRFKENYEERYSNNKPKSLKILIIRDSFGDHITHFLKEHFRETVCIFDAWEYNLNPDIIIREKPDIVMFLVLESFTDTMLQ
ncbi:MAG: hypothetical protein AB9842_03775 [Bacteroidales bacterium]